MAGRTYNYEIQSNVGGANSFFTLLTSFAVTCGWTVVDSETNKEWLSDGDGTYSWQAGNDQYAEIYSTGYGSQRLRWRLQLEYADSLHGHLWQRAVAFTDYAIDETDNNIPAKQKWLFDNYAGYGVQPLPYATMQKVHFIGDETMIFWWFQYSTLVGYGGALGTWELDDEFQNTDEGIAEYRANCTTTNSDVGDMTNPNSISSGLGTPFLYHSGSGTSCGDANAYKRYHMFGYDVSQSRIALSCKITNDEYSSYGYLRDNGLSARWMVGRNSFSNKRPLVQPALSMVDELGAGRFVFVGHLPCYLLDFESLTMGQVLEYGTDRYVAFPHNSTLKPYGFALKVDI